MCVLCVVGLLIGGVVTDVIRMSCFFNGEKFLCLCSLIRSSVNILERGLAQVFYSCYWIWKMH